MNLIFDVLQGIIKGLISSNKKLKLLTGLALLLTGIAIIFAGIKETDSTKNGIFNILALSFGGIAAFIGLMVKVYEDTKDQEKTQNKIDTLEREVLEKPTEAKTAWDLATLKLESYLNKNLQQVSAIFYLSASVMLVGFGLIIFGVYKVFQNPTLINPAIIATVSGIIVNFIGGTFLLIYKSTMKQAKNYVDVLERINAVGMSIQILENISKDKLELKDDTTAEIAKELLKIYGDLKVKSKK